MKKLATFCLAVLLFCLPVAVVASCQQTEPAQSQAPKPAIPSKTYTSSVYGFSVEYPAEWTINDNLTEQENSKGLLIEFDGPLSAEYDQKASIIIEADELSRKFTTEEYAQAVELQLLTKILPDYIKLEEQTTTISGIPAIRRTYTATMRYFPHKDIQIYFTKENLYYVITYDVTSESHDEYADCFDLVTSTFKFE
jgi:hypothetical protein